MKLGRTIYVAAVLVAIGCGGSTASPDNSGGGGTDGGDTTDGGSQSMSDGSSGTSDGSTQTGDSGGTTTGDAGGGNGKIACGMTTCDSATQDCCVSQMGAMCGAKGSCMGASLGCSSPKSCSAGQVCCATIMGMSANSMCAATCNGQGDRQLCDTNADCPKGETCTTLGGGYKYCRQAFDGGGFGDGGFPPPKDAGPG